MNREDFIEELKKQYAEVIFEAYLECEHEKGAVDFESLKAHIEKIGKAAGVEGIQWNDFNELVQSVLPYDIIQMLYPDRFSSKAS